MEFIIPASDPAVALTVGDKIDFPAPRPFVVTDVVALLKTPQASGLPVLVQITNGGVDVLSAPVGISGEAQPAFLNPAFDQFDRLGVKVTQIGDGTAKGLDVIVYGYEPSRQFDSPPVDPGDPVETLVDRTTGTAFGDMSSLPMSFAFDGVSNIGGASCAAKSGAAGYIGQSFAAAKHFCKAKVYGPNDRGFISPGNPSVTITIYGKNGANPANATDGTVLGALTFTDTGDESAGRTIALTSTTAYDHIWAHINGGAASTYCSELVLFELV